MAKAAKKINSTNAALARVRSEKRAEIQVMVSYGSAFAGAGAAAMIDSKWGDGEEPAELAGMPTNAVAAAAGLTAAFLAPSNMPGRNVIGFGALGMGNAAFYRYLFDKLEEREAEKAAKEAQEQAAQAVAAAQAAGQ